MYHFPPRLDARCDGARCSGASLAPAAIGRLPAPRKSPVR